MSDVKRRLQKLEKQLRPKHQGGQVVIFVLGQNSRGRWNEGGSDSGPDYATQEEAEQATMAKYREQADGPVEYGIVILPAEQVINMEEDGAEKGGAAERPES